MQDANHNEDHNNAGGKPVIVTQEEQDDEEVKKEEDDDEDGEFEPMHLDQPLYHQLIPGTYLLVMNKPGSEMMTPSSQFTSTHSYYCAVPFDTCRGVAEMAGSPIDPGCLFCWSLKEQLQPRIREAGYKKPNHNLFHWGEKNEHGAFPYHAYAIGPIFHPRDVIAIRILIEQFEGSPGLSPYIHLHVFQ